jgi:hypothetical protein
MAEKRKNKRRGWFLNLFVAPANADSHLPEEICLWFCKFGGTLKE